jgi:hypothetical protein
LYNWTAAGDSDPDQGPSSRAKTHNRSATWRIEEVLIPKAGTWLIRINLLITDLDKITVRTTLNIANP